MRATRGPKNYPVVRRPLSERAVRILAPSALAEDRLRHYLAGMTEARKRGFWSGVLLIDAKLKPADLRPGPAGQPLTPGPTVSVSLSPDAWRRLLASDVEFGHALGSYLHQASPEEVSGFWSGVAAMDGAIPISSLAAGVCPVPTQPECGSLPGLLCLHCNRPLPARVITTHTGRLRLRHPRCKDRARRQRSKAA